MLLTTSLLSKSTFFGTLLNKCRQVTKILPSQKKTNTLPSTSPNNSNILTKNRPGAAVATANFNSPTAGLKTLEEKIGLPPRPKKPLTPYFRFMKDLRPKLQVENPKFSAIDIIKQISKKWETVDPGLKQKLQEEYRKDQQQYVEVRAKYDSKLTQEQRAEMKQLKQNMQEAKERKMMRKRVKDLGRPKKPASGFLRFLISERKATPQLPNQTYRDWHKKCTLKWSRLSDEEKSQYILDARKEFETYKLVIDVAIMKN